MEAHPIIIKLLKAGVPVTLTLVEGPYAHNNMTVVYRIGGFYKSGTVDLHSKVFFDGETPIQGFVAHCRYNETADIHTLEDIVGLNHDWWLRSLHIAECYGGTHDPEPSWVTLYEEFGLVKKETITRYVPMQKDSDE